jgi:hypothetical protein
VKSFLFSISSPIHLPSICTIPLIISLHGTSRYFTYEALPIRKGKGVDEPKKAVVESSFYGLASTCTLCKSENLSFIHREFIDVLKNSTAVSLPSGLSEKIILLYKGM